MYPLTELIEGSIPNMICPLRILIDAEGRVQSIRHRLDGIEEMISTLPV
jgi:hypothetical protein